MQEKKRVTLQSILEKNQIMVIDGSMSTALENMGCELNDSLWTAKILIEEPDKIKEVHKNYFRAGADCGITATYQCSIPGLLAKGYDEQTAEQMIRRSVEIFLEAREEWWNEEGAAAGRVYPLCLGDIGPYGAYLADGSEYRGNYGVDEETIRSFHKRRMEILWEAGADVLLMETQPSLQEALIVADLAEELGADYWISFSCADGHHINENQVAITECMKALENHPHLVMVGVNCTAPEYMVSLIEDMKSVTNLPIAVYPNSGEVYDPQTKTWSCACADHNHSYEEQSLDWMRAGAKAVGGCCTTVEKHIRQVVAARTQYLKEM